MEFIGWKNQQEYPIHQVQLLAPVVPSALPPGTEAQAIFSEDGYDALLIACEQLQHSVYRCLAVHQSPAFWASLPERHKW